MSQSIPWYSQYENDNEDKPSISTYGDQKESYEDNGDFDDFDESIHNQLPNQVPEDSEINEIMNKVPKYYLDILKIHEQKAIQQKIYKEQLMQERIKREELFRQQRKENFQKQEKLFSRQNTLAGAATLLGERNAKINKKSTCCIL